MPIESQPQHGLHEGLTERNRNYPPFSRNPHPKISVSLKVYERSSWPRIGAKRQPSFILSPSICPHSLQHKGYIQYFLTCARILLIWLVASDRSIRDVLWKVNEICPPERLRNCCPSAVSYLFSRAISFSKHVWAGIAFLLVAGAGTNLQSMGKFITGIWYWKIGTGN